jgi:hypothetical protein
MAMDADVLGTKLAQDILALSGQPPDGPAFEGSKKYWNIVAKDFIEHILNNADVLPGIEVDTTGGPGKTTGTGKIK